MRENRCPNPQLYDIGECCGGAFLEDAATARLILDAIRKQDVYVGDDEDLRGVMVDGFLDLIEIARVVRLRTETAQERPISTETTVNETGH